MSDEGINGVVRWLNRAWSLAEHDPAQLDDLATDAETVRETQRILHRPSASVTKT